MYKIGDRVEIVEERYKGPLETMSLTGSHPRLLLGRTVSDSSSHSLFYARPWNSRELGENLKNAEHKIIDACNVLTASC